MNYLSQKQSEAPPIYTWLITAMAALIAPIIALAVFADEMGSVPFVSIGLMGAGIIGAAVSGSFLVGVILAMSAGVVLLACALAFGPPYPAQGANLGLIILVASVSFAMRGALFARSAQDKGWLIALFVVAGEAAILITAAAQPGELPLWLLALLPAQWTNVAIEASLTMGGLDVAVAPLIALAGTAAATALVACLWPRKWPYLIMFSTWIGLSVLVYNAQVSTMGATGDAPSALTGNAR